jgi:glycosyltransferase involved in cell wall biosynthesis
MKPVLMIATGWFPDDTGGLPRYARNLGETMTDAGAPVQLVVAGTAEGAPAWVDAAGATGASLAKRLAGFRRHTAVQHSVLDVHFALYGLPAVLRRRRRRPLVVHFHGPWADEAVAAGAAGRLGRALRRRLERFVYRRADALVTLSGAFAKLLADQYGVEPARIHVIPPGVDLDRFSPGSKAAARRALGLPPDAFVAVAARRLVPRVGIDVLLEAWRRLEAWRLVEAPDAQLLLIGDGPERERLERAAGSGVRFAGQVTDDELVTAYRAADVVVVPSTSLEGFGLVVLEALACGTPVIATRTGGLQEALGPFAATCTVPAGDADALGTRLHGAAYGFRLPDRRACRAQAERFSWSAAAEQHRELYARLTRPRVVYLDHTSVLAGGEVALQRLLPELEVDAHVILAEGGPLADSLLAAGVSVEILPLREGVRGLGREHVGAVPSLIQAFGAAAYAVRLARRLRQLQPDLVHANSLKANMYGGIAARLARVPIVWHVRDRVAPDYLPARAVRLMHAAERLLADAVVVDTDTVRATLARPERAHVVPSPITQPRAQAHAESGDVLRIGMVARIAPWKGQHVYLEAFARAFAHDASARAVLVGAALFGEDEEEYERGLRLQADKLGIADRVEFRGFRHDVPAELDTLDVLVHASVLAEPFGLAVVEGMAAGLPVVASASGGPTEVIDHEANGLLYAPGDVDALASALRRLRADPELRRRLGAAARASAGEFSPDAIALRIRDVYDTLGVA